MHQRNLVVNDKNILFKVFPDDNLVVIVFCSSNEASTAGSGAGLSIGDSVDSYSSKQFLLLNRD